MKITSLHLLLFLFSGVTSIAQKNLKFTPEHPQAGDLISITYTPSGDLLQRKVTVEAMVYTEGSDERNLHDLVLKKTGNQYSGTVQTDTADNFVYFSFSTGNNFDDAGNEGYWIKLYDGDKVKKGANANLSKFYRHSGRSVGIKIDELSIEKALKAMNEEFFLYPDSKPENLEAYVNLISKVKKDSALSLIQNEIEEFLKKGIKTEKGYETLAAMYGFANLRAQANFITNLMWTKFPNGVVAASVSLMMYEAENDLSRKEYLLDSIIASIQSSPHAKELEKAKPIYISKLLQAYVTKGDVEGMQAAIKKYTISGEYLARLYNSMAWKLQESNGDLLLAEEFSEKATSWAKIEWQDPTGSKPAIQSEKQWYQLRSLMYASFADTYALIQYKLGNYTKGFPFAKESALQINKGESADQNGTYALLASKILPSKNYIPELEKFVEERKANAAIKEILKKEFIKKNKEAGFEAYFSSLERRKYVKRLETLKKSMLNIPGPQFTLLDLEGNKISLEDYKNKVVILDFWATWCVPCLAAFPGMQRMVTKYKDDPEVKFLFIDTGERGEQKDKRAAEIMAVNKYTFHVLMDNDDQVGKSFKLEGLPAKFVLDKKGIIRFKPAGTSIDEMMDELTVMIDLAKGD